MDTRERLPASVPPSVQAPLPGRPLWRRILAWPSTRSGWWSVRLAGAFFAFLVLFQALVGAGQRGGDTFFSNPWLAGAILLAAGAALAGGVMAVVAIVWSGERSLVMGGPVLLGLFVLTFALGELGLLGSPPPPECGVRVERASVRSGPGYDYPVLAVLPHEAKLVPLKQNPDPSGAVDFWLLVAYDTDQRGWIDSASIGCNDVGELPVEENVPPPPARLSP